MHVRWSIRYATIDVNLCNSLCNHSHTIYATGDMAITYEVSPAIILTITRTENILIEQSDKTEPTVTIQVVCVYTT